MGEMMMDVEKSLFFLEKKLDLGLELRRKTGVPWEWKIGRILRL